MYAGLVQDRLNEAPELGYAATKKGVKNILFNLVENMIVDNIDKGKTELLLMKKVKALTQFEKLMGALKRCWAGCQLLITAMIAH